MWRKHNFFVLWLNGIICVCVIPSHKCLQEIQSQCAKLLWRVNVKCGAIITQSVFFFQFPHNIHPVARPLGRGMGCLLCVSSLIHVLLLWLQYCVTHWWEMPFPLKYVLDETIMISICTNLNRYPNQHTCIQSTTLAICPLNNRLLKRKVSLHRISRVNHISCIDRDGSLSSGE